MSVRRGCGSEKGDVGDRERRRWRVRRDERRGKGKRVAHGGDGEERDVLDIRIVLGVVGDEMVGVVVLRRSNERRG